MKISFDVEQAGCESCGKLIRTSLSRLGRVESINIAEEADLATVVLSGAASLGAVETALEEASAGAGHDYRVRSGSWRALD